MYKFNSQNIELLVLESQKEITIEILIYGG